MAIGDVIARLAVNLTLETAAFEEGANIAEKRLAKSAKAIEAIGQKMTSIGSKLSVGFTLPLVAAGKAAVDGFIEQGKAMADVTAALNSMGGASGHTADQLSKAADAMEMRSLFDADVILKQVTAQLLTFGNVSGQVFDRAQQAAIDMAQRLGGEPQAAAIMLGKALNDPVKGITALTRVGVQFTDAQKAQIKAMAEAGNAAGAQGVILAEVERQFKGAAAAAADASPWRQAQVAIGQASDVIGQQLLPLIKPAAEAIASLAGAFAALPEPIQKVAVAAGVIGAALGPLLIGIGSIVSAGSTLFAALGSIAGSMLATGTAAGAAEVGVAAAGAALAALGPLIPIVAGVAAAGALIYANWDKIGPVLSDLWQTVQTTLGPPLQQLISAVTDAFTALWNGPLGTLMRDVAGRIIEFQGALTSAFGAAVVGVIKVAAQGLAGVFQQIGDGIRLVTALFQGDWQKAFLLAGQIVNRALGGLPEYVIGVMQRLVSGVRTWIVDKLGAIWNTVGTQVQKVKGYFFGLYDAVVGHSYVPDMVDGIADQMARLDTVMVDKAKASTAKTKTHFQKLREDLKGLLERLFPEVAAREKIRSDDATITQGAAAGMINQGQATEARRRLGIETGLGDSVEGLGSAVLGGFGVISDGLGGFMDKVSEAAQKVAEHNLEIAHSFQDMADRTLGALQDLASAIKGGGVLDIMRGVLNLGLQLSSIGLFGKGAQAKTSKIPAFAGGTGSAPHGLALVGERGPELVNFRGGERVHSNASTRAMLGGARVVNNYYGPGADAFWGQVDGRAANIAAPMSSRAASAGSMGAQVALARKQSRMIP
ncbi:phage tail length tape measure family protein [uncultured Novosphingobium sp.]|uniref:phage tail length tape measure family protein n=1 Tax=uncultured Novosphingobium sp. TaxID=292277 RepID=UPI00374875DD